MSYALAEQMAKEAESLGRVLNIGVVNRFNGAVNEVKRRIESGELGEVYHVYCSFRAHRSIPGLGGPFTTKDMAGGGVLIDWGVHYLDLINYCIGAKRVLSVSGQTYSKLAAPCASMCTRTCGPGPRILKACTTWRSSSRPDPHR